MSEIGPRKPRVRLPRDVYDRLRKEVLKRDNWRCKNCGRLENLDVHHKELRSQGGDDSEFNLITLCNCCHSNEHH
jgi:5-methylcytosine-specific restriction endonuclease McrA